MIVEMAKIHVLGPRALLPDVLKFLQTRGVLALREAPAAGPEAVALDEPAREEIRVLERIGARLRTLLALVPPAKDRVSEPGALPEIGGALEEALAALEAERRAIEERRTALDDEAEILRRYEAVLSSFVKLGKDADTIPDGEAFAMLLRRDRPAALQLLEKEISRRTGGHYQIASQEIDRERTGVVVVVPKPQAPDISRLLFEGGVTEIRLPSRYAGHSVGDAIRMLLQRAFEVPEERRLAAEDAARFSARWRKAIAGRLTECGERLERIRASERCAETKHAFVVYGWVREDAATPLSDELSRTFSDRLTVRTWPVDEEEYAGAPVLLQNRPGLRPFERLLALVSLPRYGSVDPTPFLAIFYPLFFGSILGDVGHGLIALVLSLVARWRRWGGELGRDIAAIGIACASASILFGFLYGEVLGDVGQSLGLEPLLFSRRERPLAALALALSLGVAHIVVGLVLGVVASWRSGEKAKAVAHALSIAVLACGGALAAVAAGFLPRAASTPLALLVAALALAAIALEGIQAPLEMLRVAGNVFSYARLMALGLAGVMLVEVANAMPSYLGWAGGLPAAVFLHVVAFALGVMSPAIQSLRLQYVEFFDKFFREGGRPWRPFGTPGKE